MVIWRLWLEGLCTLNELETSWSIDDVMRANALLDYKTAAQDKMNKAK